MQFIAVVGMIDDEDMEVEGVWGGCRAGVGVFARTAFF